MTRIFGVILLQSVIGILFLQAGSVIGRSRHFLDANGATVATGRKERGSRVKTLRAGSLAVESSSLDANNASDANELNDEMGDGQAHHMAVSEAIAVFQTSLDVGLTTEEATLRLERYGPNVLSPPLNMPFWKLVLEQFEERLVQILLGVAALSAMLAASDVQGGESYWHAFTEPAVILLVLGINAAVGIAQSLSAEQSLDSLKKLQPSTCCALRDGLWQSELPVAQLVPGDIVHLRVGDKIPADARVLSLKTVTLST